MSQGKWVDYDDGPGAFCSHCGELFADCAQQMYVTASGHYCSEACADDAESHMDGLQSDLVSDYPD